METAQELLAWQEFLAALQDESILVGTDLNVTYLNQASLQRLKQPASEVIGRPCCAVLFGREGSCPESALECPVRQVLQTGKPSSTMHGPLRPASREGRTAIRTLPVRDSGGGIAGVICFAKDIKLDKRSRRNKEREATIAAQSRALAQSPSYYQTLFDNSGDVLMLIDRETTIITVNRRFEVMTGYNRSEVEGKKSFVNLIPEDDRRRILGIYRTGRAKPADVVPRHSNWVTAKDGRKWLAEVSATPIPGTSQTLLDLRDITESHNLQEEILNRNRELGALISVTREMVSTLDLQAVLERTLAIVCRQIEASYGFLCILDEETEALRASIFWGDKAVETEMVWNKGEGIIGWVAEHQQAIVVDDVSMDPSIGGSQGPSQSSRSMVAVPLRMKDKILGVVAAVSKESESLIGSHLRLLSAYAAQASLALENAVLYQEVKSQASTDELTRLHNRRYFEGLLRSELNRARRYAHPLSLLFMDVNHLKIVNDRYGHLQGDLLLRHMGDLLLRTLRLTDAAARYGGDEFVVLLPETNGEEATNVAERIIREVTPCPLLSGGSIPWGFSVGVAWVPFGGRYDLDLLRLADEAAYQAKREGTGWARAGEAQESESAPGEHCMAS